MLSARDIQEIIPHRYPFLLVDRILEVVSGQRAVGLKNVTINEPYFQGHFPGEPVMPGVFIVEAMAQVGAVALLSRSEFQGKLALFRGIDKCRFRGMVRPGDTLIMEVTFTALKGVVGRGKGQAHVGDKLVASGELIFALADRGTQDTAL
ncbi:MAG: 3-hydroxyacyl-[acyl-carrier-protein] dehydratase FabZ [Dethiobacter sp.]|nr:MAG: 3-hydroxyacyl-[acyl-carrier-protein] dehydratase FabZ [Dethiobacter sp.]